MYISTTVACGSVVSGTIKRLLHPYIFLDATLYHVDDRKHDEDSMDIDIVLPFLWLLIFALQLKFSSNLHLPELFRPKYFPAGARSAPAGPKG